jgi:hypothetical protein
VQTQHRPDDFLFASLVNVGTLPMEARIASIRTRH